MSLNFNLEEITLKLVHVLAIYELKKEDSWTEIAVCLVYWKNYS